MKWQVNVGDILDIPADVLICSANVYLNMSGGVGGAFLLRYGPAMQAELQRYLFDHGDRHVDQGDVIVTMPCGSPYRAVLHAVGVDGFYESSSAVVTEVLRSSLTHAAGLEAQTVALTAIATGYGRLPWTEFASGLSDVVQQEFPPIKRVVIGVRSQDAADELVRYVPSLKRA
jgi:O-acetyl-ADP-ribose deacetylase (regulator of RNase III)